MLIGMALGSLAFPLVWLAFGSAPLAATVAMALAAACSVATTIGFLLPWLFAASATIRRSARGPLATVVHVLSLLIYFLIALVLVF